MTSSSRFCNFSVSIQVCEFLQEQKSRSCQSIPSVRHLSSVKRHFTCFPCFASASFQPKLSKRQRQNRGTGAFAVWKLSTGSTRSTDNSAQTQFQFRKSLLPDVFQFWWQLLQKRKFSFRVPTVRASWGRLHNLLLLWSCCVEPEEPQIYPATISNIPLQEVPVPQQSLTSMSPFVHGDHPVRAVQHTTAAAIHITKSYWAGVCSKTILCSLLPWVRQQVS